MENNNFEYPRFYQIKRTKYGYYLMDTLGFIPLAKELVDIGENLIKFAKYNNKDILSHNTNIEE